MENKKKFQELVVWQKAKRLVKKVYELTDMFSPQGNYSLIDQMRRAAISIPSNIAEGYERYSTKEYLRFLSIANGSKAELTTQIEICRMLELVPTADRNFIDEVLNLTDQVGKMITTIMKKLTPNP